MKHEHSCYGFFPGGDPRKFHPDGDSSEEEHSNHKKACKEWNDAELLKSDLPESSPDCLHAPNIIVTRCQFGLGGYTYECDDLSCGEDPSDPDDPEDAYKSFEKWWDWDGKVEAANVDHYKGESRDQMIMRIAFAAGWKAKEDCSTYPF